jgi:CSLREA domain-containing protein
MAAQAGILYVVDSTGDGDLVGSTSFCNDGTGHCTLRAAIKAANGHTGDDAIEFSIPTSDPGFDPATGMWTINLTRALPDLSTNIEITGPGPNQLIVRRNIGGDYRIFNVTATGTVNLSGLLITNGFPGFRLLGGGVQNAGTLNIVNCTLTDNFATDGRGGGIANKLGGTVNVINCALNGNSTGRSFNGAISNSPSSTINITGSVIVGNLGGGIINDNGGAVTIKASTIASNTGSGVFNSGSLSIINSSISGNHAQADAGGIHNGNSGTVTIAGSTIDQNTSEDDVGGIFNNSTGLVTITNSTISGNQSVAAAAGGIDHESTGTVNVTNSTIVGNSVLRGNAGGITNRNVGTINVRSSIIALNVIPGGMGPDVSGVFASSGFNLIGKKDGSTGFTAGTDLTGTNAAPLDPRVDPKGLKNNGGPTKTIALQAGSPAIDKGTSNGLTGTLTTDQRGVGYSRTINKPVPDAIRGDGTDIGAFEFGAQIKAVSRKTHGTAGSFDIKLPLVGQVGVECRKGGNSGIHKLLMTFPSAVTVASASLTPDPLAQGASGNVTSFSVNGSTVTVNLTGVTNAQKILVNLLGVSDGVNTGSVSVPMGVLLADTNKSRAVDSADVTLTQSKNGQATNSTNFREDVTLDGLINGGDVQLVQSKVGTKLP